MTALLVEKTRLIAASTVGTVLTVIDAQTGLAFFLGFVAGVVITYQIVRHGQEHRR